MVSSAEQSACFPSPNAVKELFERSPEKKLQRLDILHNLANEIFPVALIMTWL